MFKDREELFSDKARATVLFAALHRLRIKHMEGPGRWGVPEAFRKGGDSAAGNSSDGATFKEDGLRKELTRKKYRIVSQKLDVYAGKLYHPRGKLGTLQVLR